MARNVEIKARIGTAIAQRLLENFGIRVEQLLPFAYIDLLEQRTA